jgi:type II secretory pathway pseudopilin PulG
MSVQINEKTEITVPLKTLISVVCAIVVASWYVFTTQNRISELEHSVMLADERFASYIKQPGRNTTEL